MPAPVRSSAFGLGCRIILWTCSGALTLDLLPGGSGARPGNLSPAGCPGVPDMQPGPGHLRSGTEWAGLAGMGFCPGPPAGPLVVFLDLVPADSSALFCSHLLPPPPCWPMCSSWTMPGSFPTRGLVLSLITCLEFLVPGLGVAARAAASNLSLHMVLAVGLSDLVGCSSVFAIRVSHPQVSSLRHSGDLVSSSAAVSQGPPHSGPWEVAKPLSGELVPGFCSPRPSLVLWSERGGLEVLTVTLGTN